MEQSQIGNRPKRTGDLICPHCGCGGKRRTSREVTGQHREIYYQCSHVACGHTWRATLSYDFGIVPSAIPDPEVTLPLKPVDRQTALEALREVDADQPELFAPPSVFSPGASPMPATAAA